jgi:hypothetical protein
VTKRVRMLQWAVVLVVGVIVVAIVLGLKLIPRLNDGQKLLDAARPAFAAERIAGDHAAIYIISDDLYMANPLVTPRGGGASEVPALVADVAQRNHVSSARALAVMRRDFPHTTALLQAIPLTSVSAELPGLLAFLGEELKLTPAQLDATLKANFPALDESIANLPKLTAGWKSITGIDGLTRFDGAPVRSVPELSAYFTSDLIPVLERQRGNYDSLDGTSAVNWFAPLLLVVGIVVIAFAALMIVRNRRGVSRTEAIASASLVVVVGVAIVALVLALSLIPRVSNGQKLLDALRPAFAQQRVAGDRVGINMVSTIVDAEDPVMTASGSAAPEVPKLIALVSNKTGLSQAQVLTVLHTRFPHVAALLAAIPFSAVTAELPQVIKALGPDLLSVIPRLARTALAAPLVTRGWDGVPGTTNLTRFSGTPARTVPQIRTYFSSDVIPVLETQRSNYDHLVSTSKINFLGPLVLIIGVIVILYGLLIVFLAWRLELQLAAATTTVSASSNSSITCP